MSKKYRWVPLVLPVIGMFALIYLLSESPEFITGVPAPGSRVQVSGNVQGNLEINAVVAPKPRAAVGDLKWRKKTIEQRRMIRAQIFALFPQVLDTSRAQNWEGINSWLLQKHDVTIPSIRQILRTTRSEKMPRIYATVVQLRPDIFKFIRSSKPRELSSFWNFVPSNDADQRVQQWVGVVDKIAEVALSSNRSTAFIYLVRK